VGIGKNIKILLNQKGLKQKDLALALDEHPVNITRWLTESRRIPETSLPKISKFLDVSIDILLGNDIKTSSIKIIPMIGNAHCGKPQEYDLNGYEPIPIAESSYKQGMYAVKTEGDSMLPKINDGDILYCIFDSVIDNGDIVHYSLNDESGIRKYKINEAQTVISLVPLNSEYDVITIHHDEHFELRMSKVVGLHREF
jgi:SOS-response transcriptional repressor LexA